MVNQRVKIADLFSDYAHKERVGTPLTCHPRGQGMNYKPGFNNNIYVIMITVKGTLFGGNSGNLKSTKPGVAAPISGRVGRPQGGQGESVKEKSEVTGDGFNS
jgi:hypothetical protein